MKQPIAIVGAGPIGLHCASILADMNIPTIVFEAGVLGNSIYRWPIGTRFFSAPDRISIGGIPIQTPSQESVSREEYLAYLRSVVQTKKLDVRVKRHVVAVCKCEERSDFVLTVASRVGTELVRASKLILATGSMGISSQINVPGETLDHVTSIEGFDFHRVFRTGFKTSKTAI